MIRVTVLLTGRLRTGEYAQGHDRTSDGRIPLEVQEGARVEDLPPHLGIPQQLVALYTLNGRRCSPVALLKCGDRVMLMPPEVAPFWRYAQPVETWTDTVLSLLVDRNGRAVD